MSPWLRRSLWLVLGAAFVLRFWGLDNGLPQVPASDIVLRHSLDIDESGDRLVMGSTTGNVWVSEDAGDSWTCVSNYLPPVYCARFA